jgi:hypothetical protein
MTYSLASLIASLRIEVHSDAEKGRKATRGPIRSCAKIFTSEHIAHPRASGIHPALVHIGDERNDEVGSSLRRTGSSS